MGEESADEDTSSVAEYMTLVGQRADFLQYLCEEPAAKRDIIDSLDYSRSTVDRAINDLLDSGLIRTKDGKYVTTATGVIAVKQYRTHIDQSADIRDAHDALEPLPPDTRLDPAMVIGASINLTEEPRPYGALDPLKSALDQATKIRAFLPNIADSRYIERYRQRVEAGATVEMVLAPKLRETLTEQFPTDCKRMATGGSYTAYEGDVPPFGVVIADQAGVTTVSVVVYTDTGSVHSLIHTGTTDCVRWADQFFSDVVSDATDITDTLASLEINHSRGTHRSIYNLGVDSLERGEYETARDYLTQAVEKFREFGETRREGAALRRLGQLELETNDLEAAEQDTQQAVKRCREANSQDCLLDSLEQLATICEKLGKIKKSVSHCREAAKLAKEAGLEDRYSELRDKCQRLEGGVAAD